MNNYPCPICGQEHLTASAKMAELVFDFLKMPAQGGNRKQTSLGPKTRCGLISAFDYIQGPVPQAKEKTHAEGKDLRTLWQTAFEAFKTASDRSHVGELPGDGFTRAAHIFGHFETILAYLHETSK